MYHKKIISFLSLIWIKIFKQLFFNIFQSRNWITWVVNYLVYWIHDHRSKGIVSNVHQIFLKVFLRSLNVFKFQQYLLQKWMELSTWIDSVSIDLTILNDSFVNELIDHFLIFWKLIKLFDEFIVEILLVFIFLNSNIVLIDTIIILFWCHSICIQCICFCFQRL